MCSPCEQDCLNGSSTASMGVLVLSVRAGLSEIASKAQRPQRAYRSLGNAMWPATAEAAQTAGLAR